MSNLEQRKFRLNKKKDIDLFSDELEDSSNESEIEEEFIQWFVFLRCSSLVFFVCFLRT